MLCKRTILAAALAGGGLGLANAPAAHAAYTVTFSEVGSDVVANGSGSIDLASLSSGGTSSFLAIVLPDTGLEVAGPASFTPLAIYAAPTGSGPSSFGPGPGQAATGGGGDIVGIQQGGGGVFTFYLPIDYVSGAPLVDTSTYATQSFASLGLTPGTYTWTFGSGASADTFTIQIGSAAVPEPASLMLLGAGLLGLGLARRTAV